MASILNFSGYSPTPVVKPPKVLGKAFNPDLLKDVPAELEKNFIQGVKSFGKSGTGGSADSYQVKPEYAKYAVKVPYIGKSGGGGQTKYYEIPTGKTYQDKPLRFPAAALPAIAAKIIGPRSLFISPKRLPLLAAFVEAESVMNSPVALYWG